MAGNEYRRLSCVDCSGMFSLGSGRGRPRKRCEGCSPSAAGKPCKSTRVIRDATCALAACGRKFTASHALAMYCSDDCRVRAGNVKAAARRRSDPVGIADACSAPGCGKMARSLGLCDNCYSRTRYKPRPKRPPRQCRSCSGIFVPVSESNTCCSVDCRTRAWRADNPERYAELAKRHALNAKKPEPRPPYSRVYFNTCIACRKTWTGSTRQQACSAACASAWSSAEFRRKAEQKHRDAAKVVACAECGCQFCPVYGAQGTTTLCAPCAAIRSARYKREYKRRVGTSHHARARRKGVESRYFNILKILARDDWTCQLCGVQTPKELRGTTDPRAPELDHILPIAAGGSHVPENCQCACRACNGAKGADPAWRPSAPLEATENV